MFEVRNEAEKAEFIMYDRIGKKKDFWTGDESGISAEEFKQALDDASPKPLEIHIDSGGGSVYEAFAMCAAIQKYPGKTTAYIDGLAASAASYIAVVCDEVVMADYAYMMIHCAASWISGNAEDLRKEAAQLDQIDRNLAAIYEKRSALTEQEVIGYMRDETWFTASEALECGLCTQVTETESRIAACIDSECASHYRHVPEAIAVVPEARKHAASHAESKLDASNDVRHVMLADRIYRKDSTCRTASSSGRSARP